MQNYNFYCQLTITVKTEISEVRNEWHTNFCTVLILYKFFFFLNQGKAWLVAQWIECRPVEQGAPGLIPSQGTCQGCGPGPA